MLVLQVRFSCGSLSITPPVSLQANEFDVRSVLHGKRAWSLSIKFMSFMATNGCKNLKIHKRLALKYKYKDIAAW